ncbi:MAG TPA: S1 RNA-binding domain-containing protein, partial [Thermoanaerobaculia bacterium]
DFGAFVEIEEGVDGLVHVSDMSWTKRIKHPSEVLRKGDDVEAIITSIDEENRRISLSIKEFQPNDFQTFREKHEPGAVVDGVVTRIADFGVFVQIEGLVEGLMHVSETPLPRGEKPQDHYHEGDPIRVRILRIDDGEMKIGLSGLDEAGQPLPAAPRETAAEGTAEPVAQAAEAETPAPAPEVAPEPAAATVGEEAVEGEAAPKKRRARKKTEEPKT